MRKYILLLIFCFGITTLWSAKIYVDIDATGANDGSSWTDAFNQVYDAVDAATPGDEIWMAEGWYLTEPTGVAMIIEFELGIYGGFEGTETARNQRNWALYETVISANIGNPFTYTDNAEEIFRVYIPTDQATIEIDGLTLRDTYTEFVGAAIINASSSLVDIKVGHCKFIANRTECISANEGDWEIENCLFYLNDVSDAIDTIGIPYILDLGRGGGANVKIINCNFNSNDAEYLIAVTGGTTELYNSILWGNQLTEDDLLVLTLGNIIIDHTLIQSVTNYGSLQTSNIFEFDPQFTDPGSGDLTLGVCSPAIDAGDAVYLNQILDLAGEERTNEQVDLGCYEYQSTANVVYVDRTATGANDGTSWTDAYIFIEDAIANAPSCAELWVAEGFYVPNATLVIDKSLKIYGGFEGTEMSRSDRNWDQHFTRLSGDIGVFNDPSDNLAQIIRIEDGGMLNSVEVDIVIDGFIIEDGNGGSVFETDDLLLDSHVKLKHCTFRDNNSGGGATVRIPSGTLEIINSLFYDNAASGLTTCLYTGSGIKTAEVSVYHTTFAENVSSNTAGASVVEANNNDLYIYNSIIQDSIADFSIKVGGTADAEVHNSIVIPTSGTFTAFEHVQDVDPEFVNSATFDFTLEPCSPAIDASNSKFNKGLYDLGKNDRLSGAIVDIGCYEREISGSKIYVDLTATGANDGSTWTNAFIDLQDAIAAANDGDEIWVAAGTYVPTSLANPGFSFKPGCGVSMYGGFAGFEILKSQRDIEANPTILSGNITGAQNANIVLDIQDFKAYAEIDGFTITLGDGVASIGGGALLKNFSGLIDNCTFLDNQATQGGAIAILNSDGGEIRNSTFITNLANSANGGAIYMAQSDFAIKKCTFTSNTATDGGALYIANANVELGNCVFDDNEAFQEGGAMYITGSGQADAEWCTIYDNFAPTGAGAVHVEALSHFETINSIYGENRTLPFDIHHFDGDLDSIDVVNCIVQGGWADGEDIITDNPEFKDPANGNFVPATCSPAIDAARSIGSMPATDIRGAARSIGNGPDIGAFEQKFPYYFVGKAGSDTVICDGDNITLTFPFQQRDTSITDLPGGDLKSGIFFDIVPEENMVLKRFHGHWIEGNLGLDTRAWVKWRKGSWIDAQLDQTKWEDAGAVAGITINSTLGDVTYIPVDYVNLELEAGKTYGFYIYLDEEGAVPVEYVRTHTPPASGFGDLQQAFEHLSVYYGRSTATAPWGAMSPFAAAFEGGVTYELYDSIQWSDSTQVISTQQSVAVTPVDTTEYYLTMFDVNGCSYTDTIVINVTPLPQNNICSQAQLLTINAPFVPGSTRCASATAQSLGSCNTNISPSVWYSVAGTESGKIRIRVGDIMPYTTNLNIKLVVFTGACGSLTEVACIDDFAANENEDTILDGIIEGQTYYIAVRGANNQEGDFMIQVKDPCVGEFLEESGLGNDTTVCFNQSITLSSGMPFKDTLPTTINSGDSVHGLFFDIVAQRAVLIHRLVSHFTAGVNLSKDVYYKPGSHVGYKYNPGAWTLAGTGAVSPGGIGGQIVEIPVDIDVLLEAGDTLSLYFYDVLGSESQVVNIGTGSNGDVAFEDDRIQILNGKGMTFPAFGGTLISGSRVLEGAVQYDIIDQIAWYRNGNPYSLDETIEISAAQDGLWSYEMSHVNGCVSKEEQIISEQDNIVRNTNDSGLNSLRDVLGCMTGFDTVFFHPLINGDTIRLSGPQISLNLNNTLIKGQGVLQSTISGENNKRIFLNEAGSLVFVENLSLINGFSTNNGGGGAIKNEGNIFLTNVRLKDNMTTINGGALLNGASAFLENVIFINNQAPGIGKHIYNSGYLEVKQNVQLQE